MANTLKYLSKDIGAGNVAVYKNFSCQLSGAYVNSGGAANIGTPGELLSFNAATVANFAPRPRIPAGPPAARLPVQTDFQVFLPQGYDAVIEQNATLPTPANFVLRIFTTAGTELGAGNYPAALITEAFLIKVRIPAKYA